MRLLVCGGRDWWRLDRVPLKPNGMYDKDSAEYKKSREILLYSLKCIDAIVPYDEGEMLSDVTIITGGAKGADEVGQEYAIVNWLPYEEYPAQWDKYGKGAGAIRNQQMIDEGRPTMVIAFPGGKGTADMVARAKKAGIPVVEVPNLVSTD